MNTKGPLHIDGHSSKKILIIALAIQFAMCGSIGLDSIGFNIPFIRQLIGFFYLVFVPGFLILNILKLNEISKVESFVYSIGLSITTLMLIGLLINFICPYFSIYNPISIKPLIFSLSVTTLILCFIIYLRRRDTLFVFSFDAQDMLSIPALFLYMVPFFAIFGTYLVNNYACNILLMLLLPIIGLIVILVAFDRFIPQNLYPLAIFVISISLLYHYSLISNYICGYDIHHEYYIASIVTTTGYWDYTTSSNVNAMLSIVMLASIFSNICAMDITWVFKIIFPLIYSLVPLGLYLIFKKLTNDKIAFLSCFFFMSLFVFYTEMLALARQQIAELFLVLLVLLAINHNIDNMKKSILLIIFAFSLIVSHYGLSYVFMFQLIFVWMILFLQNFIKKPSTRLPVFSSTLVLVYLVFAISWYMFVSSSSSFNSIVNIVHNITNNIFSNFLNPEYSQGINIIRKSSASPLHEILKYMHLLFQFFISVGIFRLISKKYYMKITNEYKLFAIINFVTCIAGITVPFFASSLNTSRLYHITLIFLSPFCVIGFSFFFKNIYSALNKQWTSAKSEDSLKWLSVFFMIFLLFNSGWVYEIVNDNPRSISLSQKTILNYGTDSDLLYFYTNGGYTPEQSVFGSKWLSKNRNSDLNIYSDYLHKSHTLQSYGMLSSIYEIANNSNIREGSYVYLGYLNVHYSWMYSSSHKQKRWDANDILLSNDKLCNIYSNGNCIIFYK